MEYARAIRMVRGARGISQAELARRASLDASYISLIEKGRRSPSAFAFKAIASALGVPVDLVRLLAAQSEDLDVKDERIAKELGGALLTFLVALDDEPSAQDTL